MKKLSCIVGIVLILFVSGCGAGSQFVDGLAAISGQGGKIAREDVFDKTGNYYDVEWMTASGTENYDSTIDMQITDTGWAMCTMDFNNNTAGNWVTEISAIGDSITWYINFWDDLGFREVITVTAMVVEYA